MINAMLIAMLSLHLLPTGPPYNPTCQTICGNQNSSIHNKMTITFMENSKATIKSTVRKIPDTMKQTSSKGVNITLIAVLMLHLFPAGPPFKQGDHHTIFLESALMPIKSLLLPMPPMP